MLFPYATSGHDFNGMKKYTQSNLTIDGIICRQGAPLSMLAGFVPCIASGDVCVVFVVSLEVPGTNSMKGRDIRKHFIH